MGRVAKFPNEVKLEIVKRYFNGKRSYASLAREINVHKFAVKKGLKNISPIEKILLI